AVLTTALEHSSMVRPLTHLAQRRGLELTVLDPDPSGRIDAARAAEALARGGFRLFAFTHASNVTGAVLDAAGLCAVARAAGVATLLDASQTAGLLSIDVGATALAASAHKGLLGPPGLGVLAVAPELDLPPVRFGGTGSAAALDRQPDEWPGAMEPGTPNTPAILGLGAALEWLDAQNPGALDRGLELIDLLRAELAPEAECFGPHDGARIPVCSFRWPGLDPAECGLLLDAAGIHVRTGMHCAPWLHRHLGTEAGGTVRVSVGPFSRADDVREVPRALRGG
ncbi:MAG: aminotransferase class V-fold PLP-dependent enzyme, partial [Planctomycetes bacterium]|nr:aminotransferase class V-fold PLP-dependent enzyme [Planctomycetota bacterium]